MYMYICIYVHTYMNKTGLMMINDDIVYIKRQIFLNAFIFYKFDRCS